ncbi:MAG: HDIG domain-containing protein [Verrucomicrobia bacterium]|nr:HDIG domain-containing protein [Verrucomicrobiota bacterium]MCH8528870.1 HDIG domain-containing protein [Kiritimatiellia bacterium]
MTDQKALVSKSRQKRTQQRTRQATRKDRVLTLQVILVFALLWKAVMALLYLGGRPVLTDLTPGQIAPFTVWAEVDYTTQNLEATEARRARVAGEVPAVLALQTDRLRIRERDLERFLLHVREHIQSPDRPLPSPEPPAGNDPAGSAEPNPFQQFLDFQNLPSTLSAFPARFTAEELNALSAPVRTKVQQLWARGMIASRDRESQFQERVNTAQVYIGSRNQTPREFRTLPTPAEAAWRAADELTETLQLDEAQTDVVRILLEAFLEPNLSFDSQATQLARTAAAQAVEPVLVARRPGDMIMQARRPVTAQMIQDFISHSAELASLQETDPERVRLPSRGILLFTGLGMSLVLMILLQPEITRKTGRLILWAVLTLLSLLIAKGVLYLAGNINLIPGHMIRPLLTLALAPLLATILHGPRFALAVGVSSSLVVALEQDMDMMVFYTGLALTLTAAIGVRSIHKRSNLFRAGLWIGGVKAMVIIAVSVSEQVPVFIIAQQGLAAFGTGLLSSILVLLLIPPFEYLFKVTTDIRLLELSDMGHPLLARLAMEAPGTYHHSLMVAHLSQAAAREIGANDLLVRVCAYYHDIGKLTKPEFFIENIHDRKNPHDDLSPSMSRLIVISHVKEGVSLAHRYKLPHIIIDGIEQHHGTSVIQYFYHRARTRNEENVTAEDYRYPGPRPKTREMGILLIADTIEAASRSIDKNKPGQIEGLVNEIIREKINDGQLDFCGLTLFEITHIRRSFIFSLNNMLHGRIAYPKDSEKADTKADAKADAKAAPAGKSGETRTSETASSANSVSQTTAPPEPSDHAN